jgi:stress response protein YsnF
MDRTGQPWDITEGTDVVGSDGNKVGEVVAVHQNYEVVEKGFFFPTDYYIPTSAIANYDGDKIYLNVTKDAALDQGWDTAPTDDVAYTTTTIDTVGTTDTYADTYATDTGATDVGATTMGAAGTGLAADTYATDADTFSTNTQSTTTSRVEGNDVLRVPVHEEELSAVTRQREVDEVQVSKDVVAEERVRVQRVAVDREVGADETAFQEGTIEVPIRGEEVELQKRTRVAEEVEIAKEAVQRTEQVAGTVRREEVVVDETGVDTTGGTRRTSTTDTTRAP